MNLEKKSDRSAYHHGNLRNDLIEEGISHIYREGFGSFSIREISRKLGVSHAAAYRHFPSRENFLRAVITEASRRFTQALVTAVPDDVTGQEALYQLGARYVLFFVEQPELLSLFARVPNHDEVIGQTFDEFSEETSFGMLKKFALPMREKPEYAGLTDREILLGFWAKVHGLATLLVTHPHFVPEGKVSETVNRLVRTAF